jgi:hypothetical protein
MTLDDDDDDNSNNNNNNNNNNSAWFRNPFILDSKNLFS